MIEKFFFVIAIMIVGGTLSVAQTPVKSEPNVGKEVGPIRSSPAYAEVLLRKTELQADLESLLSAYTEENPKIIDIRFEIAALIKDIDRLFAVRPSETGKLTLALGKMIVRKAELETDLTRLLRKYKPDNPEALRLKRKVEIYAAAIKEILG